MDLTWLLKRFDKVVQHISRPLQNKTKLKVDQEFRACWSFCFQLKALSQSSHCLPWVRCAFGNIFIWATDFNKSTQPLTTWNLSRCIIRNTYIFTTNVLICIGGGIKPMKRTRVHTFTCVKQEHVYSLIFSQSKGLLFRRWWLFIYWHFSSQMGVASMASPQCRHLQSRTVPPRDSTPSELGLAQLLDHISFFPCTCLIINHT